MTFHSWSPAAYRKDYPIPDELRIERDDSNIPMIADKLRDMLDHYEDYYPMFEEYREMIRNEQEVFRSQVYNALNRMCDIYRPDSSYKGERLKTRNVALVGVYDDIIQITDFINHKYDVSVRRGIIDGSLLRTVALMSFGEINPVHEHGLTMIDGIDKLIEYKEEGLFDDCIVVDSPGLSSLRLIRDILDQGMDMGNVYLMDNSYVRITNIGYDELDDCLIPAEELVEISAENVDTDSNNTMDDLPKLRAVMIGTDDVCCEATGLVQKQYNEYVKRWRRKNKPQIEVTYYCELSDHYRKYSHIYKIPVVALSEIVLLYKEGEIDIVIAPVGIYTYTFDLLLKDGIKAEHMYIARNRSGRKEEVPGTILRPFNRTGYVHKMLPYTRDDSGRYLGKHLYECRICGAEKEFDSYMVRDMMSEEHEEFEYYICDSCGCMQIAKIPEDLGKYYTSGYYSFGVDAPSDIVFDKPVQNMVQILDVGCGKGAFLLDLAKNGFGNLYGCDPFLDNDISYSDRVHIFACSIHEIQGENIFDHIRFGDSFEHVTDSEDVLCSARRLIKEEGKIELLIPTYPNIAFDIMGPYWYEIDAPRHITLHSIDSIRLLAAKAGLYIYEYEWEANSMLLPASLLYMNGISFMDVFGKGLDKKEFETNERNEMLYITQEAAWRGSSDRLRVVLKKKIW